MPDTRTVLLHLSDIHFRHGRTGTAHDLDADLRSQLERSAVELRSKLGVVHGIVVSGDVAFAGNKSEYDVAARWLNEICELLHCDPQNVWTVPGNHDVQRELVKKSNQLQLLHRELRGGPPDGLDDRLRRYLLDDPEAGAILFRPLQNYNAFALQFDCDVGEGRLFWEHNLILNDRSTLRIRGATSTIVSDEIDDNRSAPLVIGSVQSLMHQEDGMEYLFVCHHPPDWLLDQDNVNDHLRLRSRIQLFGHKHMARIYRVGDSLRVVAGATHPDRAEANWEPAFNVISVWVKEKNTERTMELDVYPRVWSKRDLCFKADLSEDETENHHYAFPLAPWAAPDMHETNGAIIQVAATVEQAAETSILESAHSSAGGRLVNPARRLTYRFMTLPYQVRIEVAQKLGLIENEDGDLKDVQRYEAYLRRAKERKQLGSLWEAVERAHGAAASGTENPFAGR